MSDAILMRDTFIDYIYDAAKSNRNLMFVSADFGAKALDRLREDLPAQFVHTGICEQSMVDIGAGLALAGKQVILYAMAPFLTTRCYEQTKAVLSAMHLPVAMVGVGAGLGYDHATLTHFTPEDVAIMKAINHMEVWSPSDAPTALALAKLVVEKPALRYVRLERQPMPSLYPEVSQDKLLSGFDHLVKGRHVCIVGSGYIVHKMRKASQLLKAEGIEAGVIDLFRLKTLAPQVVEILSDYESIITVEEHILEGGTGAGILEALADAGLWRPLVRLGLRDGFTVVNGDRDELHRLYGLDIPDVVAAARRLVPAVA